MAKKKTTEQLRMETILLVRSGKISAVEGAKRLGVSRTTYYKWENRALKGMAEAIRSGEKGRPGPTEEELKLRKLKDELTELQKEIDKLHRHADLNDKAWQIRMDLVTGKSKKK